MGRKVFTSQTPLVSLKEFLTSILLLLHLLLLLNDDAAESSDPVITVERGGFQKVKPIWLNKVYMKDRISFFLLMSHVSELIRANFCCLDLSGFHSGFFSILEAFSTSLIFSKQSIHLSWVMPFLTLFMEMHLKLHFKTALNGPLSISMRCKSEIYGNYFFCNFVTIQLV